MTNSKAFYLLRAMADFDAGRRETSDDPDERDAQTAVGLVMHFAPHARPGMTLAETFVAGLDAELDELRAEMRDADGRVCCCECGEPYDDAQWQAWYGEPDLMPDPEDLICAACAFGDRDADGEGA